MSTAAVVVLAAAPAGAARLHSTVPAVHQSPARALNPATIVAQWSSPTTGKEPVLELISAATGKLEGQLGTLPAGLGNVSGRFAGPGGSLWYSTSKGPKYRCPSVCAEAPAIPDSCRSSIDRLPAGSTTARAVFTLPSSETISDAVPSADGDEVAYMEQGCTGFEDMHYVVRNVLTGQQIEIGATNVRCHFASDPSWAPEAATSCSAGALLSLHRPLHPR